MRTVTLLLLLAACTRSGPSEHELLSDGQDQTRAFFALGESGDCSQLAPMMQQPAMCEKLVQQFRDTHAHLDKIQGAKIDGRDKHMVLVNVDATSPGHVYHWIVRATWTPQGWKLAL